MANKRQSVTIALDTMGGDHAPDVELHGINDFIIKHPKAKLEFILYGNKNILEEYIGHYPKIKNHVTIEHAPNVISSDAKPSVALRNSKDSSMRLAIEAVKEGRAQAILSSGNTGALMAISKIILNTLPSIDRPAIASLLPTTKSPVVFLDLGANTECSSEILFQFAIMGDAFAKITLNIDNPTVGLLNVGTEDIKGNDIVKAAAQLLKQSDLNYHGFIEGNDITAGTVDVIVTDGFTGNVALKTIEGTAKFCKTLVKRAFRASPIAAMGGMLAKRGLTKALTAIDPRNYNGAMLLGLNGIVVKSHGSTDAKGFANAINVTYKLAMSNINHSITSEMQSFIDNTKEID